MKILIIKTSSLGDIIHTFPVLQYFHQIYPQAQIDWVVEHSFSELIEAHPAANRVLPVYTKKWRRYLWKRETLKEIKQFYQQLRETNYDIVLDLQGNIKSGLMLAGVKSPLKAGFGYATVPEWPNLLFTNQRYNPPKNQNIREDYLFIAQSLLGDFRSIATNVQLKISPSEQAKIAQILESPLLQGKGPIIMVCAGSNWPNKQASEATLKVFLLNIYQKLQAQFLFIWGSPQEKLQAESLATYFPLSSLVIDKLALPTLQNLMTRIQLVLAMDSLPLHLAGTTSTPTYSLFGASSAFKYKPMGVKHQAFQGECPYQKTFEKRCPILRKCATGRCIKDLEGEALFDHFIDWWQSLPLTAA